MGVDITFTFDHHLADISMSDVARRFNPINSIFVEVAQFWSQWYPKIGPPLEPWRDASAPDQNSPFYLAPAGFTFTFGSAAVRVHHICRFDFFIRDMPAQALLRRFVLQSCEILDSDQTIYAPDEGVGDTILDLVTAGSSIVEIEAQLLLLSPPASTMDEWNHLQRTPRGRPAYFIDRHLPNRNSPPSA